MADPLTTAAAWLASAALSDAYSRAVDAARGPEAARKLRREVRRDTGIPFPKKTFADWYDNDTTWLHLCGHAESDREALRFTLDSALWDHRWWLHRRPSRDKRQAVTNALLDAVIGFFMSCLPPSDAVAVHEYREAQRHDEVIAAIERNDRIGERIAGLAPAVRRAMRVLEDRSDANITQVLDFIETNAGASRTALDSILKGPRPWIEQLTGSALLVLGEFAGSHQLFEHASALFERGASLGVDPATNLGWAALFAAEGRDKERARGLADRSAELCEDPSYSGALRAVIDEDDRSLISSVNDDLQRRHPVFIGPLALALGRADREGEAHAVLRKSLTVDPERFGQELILAGMLYDRVQSGRSSTRSADLAEVIDRALHVRDERRRWQGPSEPAVLLACAAAAADHSTSMVLKYGSPPPTGEATPAEAADDRVIHTVARAWLAANRPDEALALNALVRDPLLQELIEAKACLVAEPSRVEEGVVHVERAWALAESDDIRLDIAFTAAGLGMEPLPGGEWIRTQSDDVQALMFATRDAVLGHPDLAISRLRQFEGTSEHCAMLLGEILEAEGQIDAAVEELHHAADRFQRPAMLLRGAFFLQKAERLEDACNLLVEMIARLPSNSPDRRSARGFLLELRQAQGNWPAMAQEARTSIAEFGLDNRFRWALVGALWNQGRAPEAWRAATADALLEPDGPMTAALWARLHSRFDPTSSTVLAIADLLDQHLDDESIAIAIAQSLITIDTPDDPDEADRTRFNEVLDRFFERYPDNPALMRVQFGDKIDDLMAFLRQSLEPTAAAYDDLKATVAAGNAPYSALGTIRRRMYTASLLHRAAGCLLIYPEVRSQIALERADARAAVGRNVIVDPSVLVLAASTKDHWSLVQSSLGAMTITEAAFRDVVASRVFCDRGDGLAVGWDSSEERPVVTQTDSETLAEIRSRAAWVEERAGALRHIAWSTQKALDAGSAGDRKLDSDDLLWAWASALDYAKANGIPYFSDDRWSRDLARHEGVPSFGSAALAEVFLEDGTITSAQIESLHDQWRSEYCVDIPNVAAWIVFARRNSFQTGPTTMALSRPALWRDDLASCLRAFNTICHEVGREGTPPWLFAATQGVKSAVLPHFVTRTIAQLILIATIASSPSPSQFARLIDAAREGLKVADGDVGLELVFRALLAAPSPAQDVTPPNHVLALASELNATDREVARRVVFDVPSSPLAP